MSIKNFWNIIYSIVISVCSGVFLIGIAISSPLYFSKKTDGLHQKNPEINIIRLAQKICPSIYNPVCGRLRGGSRRTFPNECLALQARAAILHRGSCSSRCPAATDITTGLSSIGKSAIGGGLAIQLPGSPVCHQFTAIASGFLDASVINPNNIHVGIFTNGSAGGGDTIRVKGGAAVSNISFGGLSGSSLSLPASTSAHFSKSLSFTFRGENITTTIVKSANSNTISPFFPNAPDTMPPKLTSVVITSNNPDPRLAMAGDTITVTIATNEKLRVAPSVTIAGQIATVAGSGLNLSAKVIVSGSTPMGIAALSIANIADAAGNSSATVSETTDGSSVSVDTTSPAILISGVPPTRNDNSTFTATFKFSEKVVGFVASHISVVNGRPPSGLVGDGQTYTAKIRPIARDTVIVIIPAGIVRDAAGNPNIAAAPATSIFIGTPPDTIRPTVSIKGVPATRASNSSFTAIFKFNEDVIGFTGQDIIVTNGRRDSSLEGAGSTYSASITPIGKDTVFVVVPQGSAKDEAGNVNFAASARSRFQPPGDLGSCPPPPGGCCKRADKSKYCEQRPQE